MDSAVLLALSTSHKIGLGLVALVFIGFALASSFLLPRYRPDYPGSALRWFVVGALALFVGMMLAVEFFGREPAEAEHKAESTEATTATSPIRLNQPVNQPHPGPASLEAQ